MSLSIITEPIPLQVNADGVVRIGRTRVTLDTLVVAFNQGATAEEIVYQYPFLQLADVYYVISFYLRNQHPVEEYLQERQQRASEIRKLNEAKFDPQGVRVDAARLVVRHRLLSRRMQ